MLPLELRLLLASFSPRAWVAITEADPELARFVLSRSFLLERTKRKFCRLVKIPCRKNCSHPAGRGNKWHSYFYLLPNGLRHGTSCSFGPRSLLTDTYREGERVGVSSEALYGGGRIERKWRNGRVTTVESFDREGVISRCDSYRENRLTSVLFFDPAGRPLVEKKYGDGGLLEVKHIIYSPSGKESALRFWFPEGKKRERGEHTELLGPAGLVLRLDEGGRVTDRYVFSLPKDCSDPPERRNFSATFSLCLALSYREGKVHRLRIALRHYFLLATAASVQVFQAQGEIKGLALECPGRPILTLPLEETVLWRRTASGFSFSFDSGGKRVEIGRGKIGFVYRVDGVPHRPRKGILSRY